MKDLGENGTSIVHVPDAAALSRGAADRFAVLTQAAARKGRVVVALSGGNTPRALYHRLAEAPWREQVPWDKLHFFWGDERCVPPDHPDSNYRMAREALFEKVRLPAAHIHPVSTQSLTPEAAAMEYEREMRFFFGAAASFDVILLGLGEDGHTASLFPGTKALDETRRWAVDVVPPAAPHPRVTLTFTVLNKADNVLFLVSGAAKAAMVKNVLEGPPNRFPAQRVAARAVEWWLDAAAAGSLPVRQAPTEK